jgi:hypothetical protein
MRPYVVHEGDHLKRIAQRFVFDPETIWNHPKNADLKARRESYNVLLTGDIVYIPEPTRAFTSVRLGQVNVFSAPIPRCTIEHVFEGDKGPLKSLAFRVMGGDNTKHPKTDGNGTAIFDVPVTATEVQIIFETGRGFVLALGHLDPASSRSGCIQRLRHLGLLGRGDEATSDGWLACALSAFQKRCGIPQTGVLDEATVKHLRDAYGC